MNKQRLNVPIYPISVYFSIITDLSNVVRLSKTINLPAIPYPGCYFEYESGWSGMLSETGNLMISPDFIEFSKHVDFNQEEINSLIQLGWKKL